MLLTVTSMMIISFFIDKDMLNEYNFINWDGKHYYNIKNEGYKGINIAFFPLFPSFWAFINVSIYNIVIINIIIWLSSFYYLIIQYSKLKLYEIGLYLTVPSLLFCGVAYTEAFYFGATTLLIVGIKQHKKQLLYLGLFAATLCRPAFIFFAPALAAMELYGNNENWSLNFLIKKTLNLLSYALCLLLALGAVFLIHYYQTGNFWAYFEASKQWGGVLILPKFPLTTWGAASILKLDAASLCISLSAGFYLLYQIIKYKLTNAIPLAKELIFALAYMGVLGLFLFFRAGTLFSLNRFVLVNPFFIIIVHYFINSNIQFNKKQLASIFLAINLFMLLFGSYSHIKTLISFTVLACFLLLPFLLKYNQINKNYDYIIIIIITAVNFVLQLYFYTQFLSNEWVG